MVVMMRVRHVLQNKHFMRKKQEMSKKRKIIPSISTRGLGKSDLLSAKSEKDQKSPRDFWETFFRSSSFFKPTFVKQSLPIIHHQQRIYTKLSKHEIRW